MTVSTNKSVIVLIGGGHAAGKRTAALLLQQEIQQTLAKVVLDVQIISLNDYKEDSNKTTIDTSKYSINNSVVTNANFKKDKFPPLKPSRFNFEKLKQYLTDNSETLQDQPQKVLIVHGLYALYDKELRNMSQIKVFIDGDSDARLIRWIRRDVLGDSQDKTDLETLLNTYVLGARAEMSDFIFPTKEFADVIMPRGAESNAVKLIFDGILTFLADKHCQPERMYLPHTFGGNYLRPNDPFERENIDGQKSTFYELN
ncbi:uncharacterized protein RJT21DRAFT_50962 [Scheffersomyces amazonensis]|uniref:uncharacterized protein n=1 Tax=Scheffersomyces amazonensis TaxID=1078765 RepID=UPI00315D0F6F